MLNKLDRKFKYVNKNKCCSKISIPSLHLLDPDQREVNFLAEYGHTHMEYQYGIWGHSYGIWEYRIWAHSYGINMNMEYGHTQPRT